MRRGRDTGLFWRFIGSRLLQGVIVVLGAIFVSFVLTNLTGSPSVASGGGLLTKEQVWQRDEALGYHDPLVERFVHYIGNAVQGDFGESIKLGASAFGLVTDALPYTLMLLGGALAIALLLAVPSAVYSVLHRDTRTDRSLRIALLVGLGLPEFWLGLVFILVFSARLGWTQGVGYQGVTSAILPCLALGIPLAPSLARVLRGEMLDAMESDFVIALRAKRLPERTIVLRHALRNALPTFITFLALQVGYLLGGTLVVEAVFTWPGIGTLTLTSVEGRDVTVVQATVVVLATTYVFVNLLADVLVQAIDPRIRLTRR